MYLSEAVNLEDRIYKDIAQKNNLTFTRITKGKERLPTKKKDVKCLVCAGNHHHSDKENCKGKEKCANCEGDHVSCSSQCPHIKQARDQGQARAQERKPNIINNIPTPPTTKTTQHKTHAHIATATTSEKRMEETLKKMEEQINKLQQQVNTMSAHQPHPPNEQLTNKMDDENAPAPNWYNKIVKKLSTLEKAQEAQQQQNDSLVKAQEAQQQQNDSLVKAQESQQKQNDHIDFKIQQIREDQTKHLTNFEVKFKTITELLYAVQANLK
eukprot:Pgem_evm1s1288